MALSWFSLYSDGFFSVSLLVPKPRVSLRAQAWAFFPDLYLLCWRFDVSRSFHCNGHATDSDSLSLVLIYFQISVLTVRTAGFALPILPAPWHIQSHFLPSILLLLLASLEKHSVVQRARTLGHAPRLESWLYTSLCSFWSKVLFFFFFLPVPWMLPTLIL